MVTDNANDDERRPETDSIRVALECGRGLRRGARRPAAITAAIRAAIAAVTAKSYLYLSSLGMESPPDLLASISRE